KYQLKEGTTDNLMDYGQPQGTKLWKYQWDLIHDPEGVLFAWTEEVEEGASSGIIAIELRDVKFSGENKFNINTYIDNTPSVAYHGSEDKETIKIKIKPRFEATEENTANRFWSKIKVFAAGDEEPLYEGDPQRVRKPAFKDYYKPSDYWELELPNQVGFYPDFRVEYYTSLAEDGDFEKIEDEYSGRLYMTLNKPSDYAYFDEQLLYFGCKQTNGLKNDQEVIDNIWSKFKIDYNQKPYGNLYQKDFNPNRGDVRIGYYTPGVIHGNWSEAINSASGTCVAFADLFAYTLKLQGISAERSYYECTGEDKGFLIKQWNYLEQGTSGDKDYPYQNAFEEEPFNPSNGKYHWVGAPDVDRITGGERNAAGQNNQNPLANFSSHSMVQVGGENGKIYDPSYGVVYDSINDFVDKAIDGYFKESITTINEQQYNTWLIRKPN
ncbi:MAG: hypothetical protein ACOCPM_06425, partial [Bacteroidales bacterium]